MVVDLDPEAAALIDAHSAELAGLGLIVEGFGPGAVMVREAPAAIAQGDLGGLVRDLAADLAAEDGAQTLARRLDQRLATFACHHSVRSGRPLKPEEMNALLREMEATPGAGQCNHGRPTYVELKLSDIERLFGRRGRIVACALIAAASRCNDDALVNSSSLSKLSLDRPFVDDRPDLRNPFVTEPVEDILGEDDPLAVHRQA